MEAMPLLYSFWRSSCSWRVRIVLALKKIEYEIRSIDLQKREQVDKEYRALNPMGQVPALVVDGHTMTQSLSIMEYIEDAYPEIPLLPTDLFLRAKVRELCNIIVSGIQPLQNNTVLTRVGDENQMQWAHDFVRSGLEALEQALVASSGKFCVGDDVTLADCCLVPQVHNAGRYNVDLTCFPTIRRINENLIALEAFKEAHPSK